jgi:hypothetical protein
LGTEHLLALKSSLRLSAHAVHAETLESFFREALSILKTDLRVSRISLILTKHRSQDFYFAAGLGFPPKVLESEPLTLENNILEIVLRSGEGVFCADMKTDSSFGRPKKLRYQTETFVCVPLKVGKKITGFISVTEPENARKLSQEDFLYLSTFAEHFVESLFGLESRIALIEKAAFKVEEDFKRLLQKKSSPLKPKLAKPWAFGSAFMSGYQASVWHHLELTKSSGAIFSLLNSKTWRSSDFALAAASLSHSSSDKSSQNAISRLETNLKTFSQQNKLPDYFLARFEKKGGVHVTINAHFDTWHFKEKQKKAVPLVAKKGQEKKLHLEKGDFLLLGSAHSIKAKIEAFCLKIRLETTQEIAGAYLKDFFPHQDDVPANDQFCIVWKII